MLDNIYFVDKFFDRFESFLKKTANFLAKFTSYTTGVHTFVFIAAWLSIGYSIFLVLVLFPVFHIPFYINNINIIFLFFISGIITSLFHFINAGGLYKIGVKVFYKKFKILNENFINIDTLKTKEYTVNELRNILDKLNYLPFYISKEVMFYAILFLLIVFLFLFSIVDNFKLFLNYLYVMLIMMFPSVLLYRFSAFIFSDNIVSHSRYIVYKHIYKVYGKFNFGKIHGGIFRLILKLIILFLIDFFIFFALSYYPVNIVPKSWLIISFLIFIFFFKSILIVFLLNIWYKSSREIERVTDLIQSKKVDIKDAVVFPQFNDPFLINIFDKLNNSFLELISSRKDFEKKLNERTKDITKLKNFLEDIIKNLPIGVLYAQKDGIIVFTNDIMKDIIGIDNIINKNLFNIIPENIKNSIINQTGNIYFNNKEAVLWNNGYYKIIKREIMSNEGFILVALDVTNEEIMLNEILITNQMLQKKTEESLQASKAKSVFLANMSHEIRTPLNSIIGFIDILLNDTKLDTKIREKLKFIESSSYTLLQLISNILDVAKIESGKIEIVSEPVNFVEFITGISNIVKGYSNKKSDVDIIFDIDVRTPVNLKFDSLRLRQVLINLLSNSIKFTKQGNIILSVKVLKKDNSFATLMFSVSDTGIGIPEDKIEKILKPFEQAEKGTTKQYGGTGLGLTLSSELISLLGGKLNIKSVSGKGSEFSFSLRLEIDNSKSISNLVDNASNDIKKLRVVFLDDNDFNLKIYNDFSKIIGVEFFKTFNNYNDFISDVKVNEYDLFFIDINMPDKSGLEVVKELKSDVKYKNKFFISVSSVSELNIREYYDAGFTDIMVKPILLMDFVNKVKNLIEKNAKNSNLENKINFNKYNINVLVAEDIKMNQMVISNLLDRYVNKIDMAEDGEKAVKLAMENKYDLILMDLHMPVMDGYDATRKIRKFDNNVKIVALTADALPETIQKCKETGMNDVITKPIRIFELEKVLKSIKLIKNDTKETFNWIDNLKEKLKLDIPDIKDILLEFESSFKTNFKELKTSIKEKNIKSFEEISHSLKGMVKYLYHNKLIELFTKINNYGKEGKIPENISEFINDIEKVWEKMKKDIKKFI